MSHVGNKENERLALKYKVHREQHPAYRLFLKNRTLPIGYNGDRTEDDLKYFVLRHVGNKELISKFVLCFQNKRIYISCEILDLWLGLPGLSFMS